MREKEISCEKVAGTEGDFRPDSFFENQSESFEHALRPNVESVKKNLFVQSLVDKGLGSSTEFFGGRIGAVAHFSQRTLISGAG